MLKGKTLLERFRDPQKDNGLVATQSITEVVDSVLQHLTKMLNTRVGGSALIQPEDYGMADLSDVHNYPDAIVDMQKNIREAISKYEPRLKDVRVEYEPPKEELIDSKLNLKFKITARLVLRRSREPVYFETLVRPSGQVYINE